MIIVEPVPIYQEWLKKQDKEIQAKISEYIIRLGCGNTSNLKGLKGGISEIKIHYGAGIRVYLKKKNENYYIVLWGGADKKSQQKDIEKAISIKQFMEATENEENKH
jgi:putative addiction module killer protein